MYFTSSWGTAKTIFCLFSDSGFRVKPFFWGAAVCRPGFSEVRQFVCVRAGEWFQAFNGVNSAYKLWTCICIHTYLHTYYIHCLVNIIYICIFVFFFSRNTCFLWIVRARLLSDKPWCSVSMIGVKVEYTSIGALFPMARTNTPILTLHVFFSKVSGLDECFCVGLAVDNDTLLKSHRNTFLEHVCSLDN